MERMRLDDHFMVLLETDETPMHVGSLLILDVPPEDIPTFYERMRARILSRLPHTPLLRILRQSPNGYDSDAWFSVPVEEAEANIRRAATDQPLSDEQIQSFIAVESMKRLDLKKPPFEVVILDNLTGNRVALYIKVHHCLTDGVGFQTLLGIFADDAATDADAVAQTDAIPSDDEWLVKAETRFDEEALSRDAAKLAKTDALGELKAFNSASGNERSPTPVLKLTKPTSASRDYRTVSWPLEKLKAAGIALSATVNDVFLWVASTALRDYLLAIDDLPEESISINSARSYRTDDHGFYGNRIVAIRPKIETNIADPIERLRAIQASMALEKRRSDIEVKLLDQPDFPNGAAKRRQAFAQRTSDGTAVLAGNITLSNVPGPKVDRYFDEFRQIANFPVPLLGSGRFLNITSRRNGDYLDWGIMADPEQVSDLDGFAGCLHASFDQLEKLAGQMTDKSND